MIPVHLKNVPRHEGFCFQVEGFQGGRDPVEQGFEVAAGLRRLCRTGDIHSEGQVQLQEWRPLKRMLEGQSLPYLVLLGGSDD